MTGSQINKCNSTTTVMNNWITNTQTSTSTMYSKQLMLIQNTNSTHVPTSNSVSLLVNQYLDVYDGTGTMVGASDEEVRRRLEGRGLALPDGSYLKIRDGKPIIEHRHTEGCEKLRPVPVSHYGTIDFSDSDHILAPNSVLRLPDGTYLRIDSDGNMIVESFINARNQVVDVSGDALCLYESLAFCHFGDIHIPDGAKTNAVFTLPNGVTITLFPDDHVEIDESNGRQLYRTEPVRGFNKFMNASDLLEDFIAYCASEKMTRKDFAELPVSLFIYWLIVQAAEADGDSTAETIPLLTSAVKQQKYHPPQCKCCGQFIAKKLVANGINFCSSAHMQKHMDKL